MDKTKQPQDGYYWINQIDDETVGEEGMEIVEVSKGQFYRIGRNRNYPIDGQRSFYGPIPLP